MSLKHAYRDMGPVLCAKRQSILLPVDRERMQKMELQLESLSDWVHRNLSSGRTAVTTMTSTTDNRQNEAVASTTPSTCCSAMSSKSSPSLRHHLWFMLYEQYNIQ